MKDYLGYENARNKTHAETYIRLVRAAYGPEASEVLIGHHITFESDGDLNTENEIPSADTLMFDHEIMRRVFGRKAQTVMAALAVVPVEDRDALLKSYLDEHAPALAPAAG